MLYQSEYFFRYSSPYMEMEAACKNYQQRGMKKQGYALKYVQEPLL